ncbi:MAG: hypothetical protein QOD06_63 [Candidatus Binatota bacterium]|jgi:GNAT superfamily N-acetyltransferase|nr:hypothetical protein [Candidatus Binatota bacterium]
MTRPRFVPAGESDAPEIVAMMRELYELDGYGYDGARALEAVCALLRDPRFGRIWLIHAEEPEPVGYVVLTLGYSLEFHGRDAFLDELYVREPHRGRGVGTAAIAVVEEACRELGVGALHLEVERRNVRAAELYRRLAYVDHDRFLMTKRL